MQSLKAWVVIWDVGFAKVTSDVHHQPHQFLQGSEGVQHDHPYPLKTS